jgi:hypothetical protein
VLGRWFACGVARSLGEDEPNHPRHQPNAAVITISTTSTPTSASLKAKRKKRGAINRKASTTSKTIRAVVIVSAMITNSDRLSDS